MKTSSNEETSTLQMPPLKKMKMETPSIDATTSSVEMEAVEEDFIEDIGSLPVFIIIKIKL